MQIHFLISHIDKMNWLNVRIALSTIHYSELCGSIVKTKRYEEETSLGKMKALAETWTKLEDGGAV